MTKHKISAAKGLAAVLFWLLVWYLAALGMDQPLLPPGPAQVFRCLGELVVTAGFWQITLTSIARVLLGLLLGIVLGVLLAVLTASSSLLHGLIAPAMTAMQATPVASFAILVLIWVDRNEVPVLICCMLALPVVWHNVSGGIRVTDPQLMEMAQVFCLTRWQILKRIYVPSVMPFFRTACSSALGLGWKAGIAAEVIGLPSGSLGEHLYNAKVYYMTPDLFAWTAVIVLVSVVFERLFLRAIDILVGKAGAK
jgi:NitT/TauT family transport system permease protein